MINIAKRQILPVVIGYSTILAGAVESIQAAGATSSASVKKLNELCELADSLQDNIEALEAVVEKAAAVEDTEKQAQAYHVNVIPAMNAVREVADKLEMVVDAEVWPLPTYAEMLFMR